MRMHSAVEKELSKGAPLRMKFCSRILKFELKIKGIILSIFEHSNNLTSISSNTSGVKVNKWEYPKESN
jgi:hypothetical protein